MKAYILQESRTQGSETELQELYCERCDFATPIWTKKCIHCRRVLACTPEKLKLIENAA
jgi:uncharacterized UBP type Zn finger protein